MAPRRPARSCRVATAILVFASVSAIPSPGLADDGTNEAALQHYHAGNGLLNRGHYELAIEEYRTFLAEHPRHEKSATARYGLAVSLFRLGRYAEAMPELDVVVRERAFPFEMEATTILGQSLLATDQFEEAAKVFRRGAERHEEHDLADDATAGWAEAAYRLSDHKQVLAVAEQFDAEYRDSDLADRVSLFASLSSIALGDDGAAIERLERLLRESPDGEFSDRASLLLAQSYHRLGRSKESVQAYRRLLADEQSPYRADALYGLAVLLHATNEFEEAGEVLDELLAGEPPPDVARLARFLRARVFFDAGSFDDAVRTFDRIAREGDDLRDDAAYWLTKCDLRKGDARGAARRLQRFRKDHTESALIPEATYDLAVAQLRDDKPDAAAEVLAGFLKDHPDNALAESALYLLAVTEHRQERYEQSSRYCSQFARRYESSAHAAAIAFIAAENEFLQQQYAKAIKLYQDFVERFPADEQVLSASYRTGLALYRTDELDEALAALTPLADHAKSDGSFRPALLALGDIHFRRGAWNEAESYLSAYVESNDAEGLDDALLKLGLARQRGGKDEPALAVYDRLIADFAKSPHRLQAYFEKGQILAGLGRSSEATNAFEQVLRHGNDSRFAAHALNHLASIAMQSDEPDKAAKYFDKAAKASTNDDTLGAEAQFQKGQALMAAADFAAAEREFDQFLSRHGDHGRAPVAAVQQVLALARLEKYAEVIKAAEHAEQRFGKMLDSQFGANMLYEKAWALRELDKTDDAKTAYGDLRTRYSDQPLAIHATMELAELQAAEKNFEIALSLLAELDGMLPTNASDFDEIRAQAAYRAGVCAFELGRFADAAGSFEQLLSSAPKHTLAASASYYCGEANYRLGRMKPASTHLQRVVDEYVDDPAHAPAMLRLGECLAALQKWSASEQVFMKFLDQYRDSPQWYQAQFGIGWARENMNRHNEAIDAYRTVAQKHKGETAARAQFQIGECLFARKAYDEAARELLKVDILYAYPEWSAAALYEAGRCFEQLGKPVEARQQFKEVVGKYETTRWAELANERLSALSSAGIPGR